MNRAQDFTRLEDRLLEQNFHARVKQIRRDVLQLGRRSSLADRVDDGLEPMKCEPRRRDRQHNEDDFFNRSEQRTLPKERKEINHKGAQRVTKETLFNPLCTFVTLRGLKKF